VKAVALNEVVASAANVFKEEQAVGLNSRGVGSFRFGGLKEEHRQD
jgi:hypothetical protein